ncbi:uncharacterized protein MELLADRAFT_65243 [Melampsora larici-populina 98AG31]|uniref:Uncharacterized protein n=1 Tax=Melampsora larici-populina (strain 98AG31 / pathotype 3-4-7) TaxID=747676 RepID=F4RUK1_MELLP|nr:uncharacterized protein MELLADRAFT_65243 [Melampsora larici-populina 98AG31]EGG03981.1 hypothetical protein MELLADRAFT_65243 [Melampsora larici-populina 98AG31]
MATDWVVHGVLMTDGLTGYSVIDANLESIPNRWMMEITESKKAREEDRLEESKVVLHATLVQFLQRQSRLCITWDADMYKILNQTVDYSSLSGEEDRALELQWNGLVRRAREDWKEIAHAPILDAEPLNEAQVEELEILAGVDEGDMWGLGFGELDLEDSDFEGGDDDM